MINDDLPNVLRSLIGQTVQAMHLSDFVLGVVTSESPLLIRIDDKRELDEDF